MTTTQTGTTITARPPIALSLIDESPFNTRKDFGDLDELGASIKEVGLLEGLLMRPGKKAGRFELVAGARRTRAMKKAKITEVTNYEIRNMDDGEAMAAQIVENLQRENISALEEAEGFAQLQKSNPETWTVQAIAKKVGKSDRFVQQRLSIANNLAPELKKALAEDKIGVEAARTLAAFPVKAQRALPSWALNHHTSSIRAELFSRCIPDTAAKFDPALYKGDWIDNDGKRKYFADPDQFMKLQKGPAEKKLAEVQKDWPKATLVTADEAAHLCWPDPQYAWSIDNATSQREGDKPRNFKVAKDKCRAIVWIAPNGTIRKALGVCSKAMVEAALAKSQKKTNSRSYSGGGRSHREKPAHRKERLAFNSAVAAGLKKKADVATRWQLFRAIGDDDGFVGWLAPAQFVKILPPTMKRLKFGHAADEGDKLKIWQAIAKLPIATIKSTIAKIMEVDAAPEWMQHSFNDKPIVMVALAQSLGVKVPAIALPDPPKISEIIAEGKKPAPKKAEKKKGGRK